MDHWIQAHEVKVACEREDTPRSLSKHSSHSFVQIWLWHLNIQTLQNLGKLISAHRYTLTHIQISGNKNIPFCMCCWEVLGNFCKLFPYDVQTKWQLCTKSQNQNQLKLSLHMLQEVILFSLHDTWQQSFPEKYVYPGLLGCFHEEIPTIKEHHCLSLIYTNWNIWGFLNDKILLQGLLLYWVKFSPELPATSNPRVQVFEVESWVWILSNLFFCMLMKLVQRFRMAKYPGLVLVFLKIQSAYSFS